MENDHETRVILYADDMITESCFNEEINIESVYEEDVSVDNYDPHLPGDFYNSTTSRNAIPTSAQKHSSPPANRSNSCSNSSSSGLSSSSSSSSSSASSSGSFSPVPSYAYASQKNTTEKTKLDHHEDYEHDHKYTQGRSRKRKPQPKKVTKPSLPIDIQFSIPALVIIILYSFAHFACFEMMGILTSYVESLFPQIESPDVIHLGFFVMGFFILRLCGDLWVWSDIVESESFHETFKNSKRYRKQLASQYRYCLRNKCLNLLLTSSNASGDEHSSVLTTTSSNMRESIAQKVQCWLEMQKLSLLNKDVQMMRWMKGNNGGKHLAMILSLVGFYFVSCPAEYFVLEKLQTFAALDRHELIRSMPSYRYAKDNGISNPSLLFDQMLQEGMRPLLTEEEIEDFLETYTFDEDYEDGDDINILHDDEDDDYEDDEEEPDEQSLSTDEMMCPSMKEWVKSHRDDINYFMRHQIDLTIEDNMYLNSTTMSVEQLFGERDIDLYKDEHQVILLCATFGISLSLLLLAKVPFFDI